MGRLTQHDAAAKAIDLQRTITRLATVVDQKPHGSSAAAYEVHRKQLANGCRHELEAAVRLVAELVAGLEGSLSMPAVAGPTDTSASALAAALPKASGNRAKILDAMWCNGLAMHVVRTDVQLHNLTGLPANTVRPRRGELVAQGWIEDSGQRLTHNGRPHIAWRLTEAAQQRLQTQEESTG